MNLHSMKLILLLPILTYSCSEAKKPTTTTQKSLPAQELPADKGELSADSVGSLKSKKAAHLQGAEAITRKRILEDVKSSLEPLSQGADAISTIKNGWVSFTHPSLSNAVLPQEFAGFLQFPQKSLREELSNPLGKWNTDAELRRAAVGRSALMVSLIGSDGSELHRFPELMADAEQRGEVTEGDLLLLKCATQAMSLVEGRPELPDAALPNWIRLAKSPNPACRAAALIVFMAMRSIPAHQSAFYGAYDGESCLPVAKMYIELLGAADIAPAPRLITQFKSKSPAAPQLGGLIDETLAKLHEKTQ